MEKTIEQHGGDLIIFVRRGPPECNLRIFSARSNIRLEFRVMPSLYYRESPGREVIMPLLERLVTITVEPIAVLPIHREDTRFYRIDARLESQMRYANLMPADYPVAWRKTIPIHSAIQINYDCEDRVGELHLLEEGTRIPFPANFQCIRDTGGDYHVIETQ